MTSCSNNTTNSRKSPGHGGMLLDEKAVAHRRDDKYPYRKVASIKDRWLNLIPDKD